MRTLITRWGGLPGTALFRSINGFEGWTTEAQLLASVIDHLAILDYHQVKIANPKGTPQKPVPLGRPWDKPRTRYGSAAMPFDEIDAWMQSTWK